MRTAAILMAVLALSCGRRTAKADLPLVPASTTMVTAWQIPRNPLDDHSLDSSPLAAQIRLGYQLFTNTPTHAPTFTGGTVSCANCHLNAGQRERALPVVGVSSMFPEYNARASRLITLADRVIDCFLRSENATGSSSGTAPSPTSKEVLALTAYITWLSKGQPVGVNPKWRGQNAIARDHLIPIARLDAERGRTLYAERCSSCHGIDGQGVQIGDKKAGPLWGPHSWNDGAGASRVYTLAGIIRYSMPYLDPGSLSDEEAQHIAAFITSQPRPEYPHKDLDYASATVPVDAVYYPGRRGDSGAKGQR
ncbi:MAG TPA: c-type cytochrome [Vicinamibacterales bacterium]|jgi:thiosulfate dehydrogenase